MFGSDLHVDARRMSLVRRILGLAVAAVLLAACSDSSPDESVAPVSSTTTTTLPEYTPVLEDRECGYQPPLEVRTTCSWLVVPEDRAKTDGRRVRLAVAVLHSTAKQPRPDPVVYLHGGPGGDAVAGARGGWEHDSRLAKRDVILWDQRGAGLSRPSLNCPEVDEAIRARFTKVEPFTVEFAERRAAVERCRARLVGEGIDLNQYTSETSAADLADLRRALKIEEWNLVGVSYGTRLALTAMRSQPEGIRSVLLDSGYPTTVGGVQRQIDSGQRAVDELVEGCAESATCAKKYGDLNVLIEKAYAQLDADPFRGAVDLGAKNGGTIELAINGEDAAAGLFTALYDEELIPVLPSVIDQISKGEYGLIPAIAQQGIPFATQFSDGAALSVECADNGRLNVEQTRNAVADPGQWAVVVTESSTSYCDVWNVQPASEPYNQPVRSGIPALALAGRYDPVTPPADTKAAADALGRPTTYVEIDGIGHGVIFSNACGSAIYRSFLDDPEGTPDTACAREQPAAAFG